MTVSGATSACSRQDPNWDERVRRLATAAKRGDGDPLDICVQSERAIARSEIIVRGRVIGGLQMIDGGEADDKIVSVLENDYVWGGGSQRERGASGAGGATSALLFDVQARAGPARAGTHCQGVWTGSSVFETSPFVLAADLFGLRRRYAFLAPLLDAEYGSGAFVPVTRPAKFEVRISTTGLLIREEKSER